ncbi:hypothetical protein [Pyrococcus abyssi]|uniref:Uncharacterized protein n=1 Tax=Pyrococcus abyssi (strain GE5 / Orsay) TaxID=272844 RepID=Q9V2H3_PYRAB|nr:hypothetical protein [Pyrococcus abyssi]CAB49025.1 Hypothetical protein PAB0061 [Pyrococcus abyssi GE5]CCE69477.1 TPA: hypothetical protein PAB0061 [Pyrococcus abyssi GE5]
MFRKIIVIIFGILVITEVIIMPGTAKADIKATSVTVPNTPQDLFVSQLKEKGYLFFKGNNSIKLAQGVLEKLGKNMTISFNVSALKNRDIAFVGIALRPLGKKYITMLYVVEGQCDVNDVKEFLRERITFLREPLIMSADRDWKFIGSTTWKVKYTSQYGGQVYHAIRVKYYYTTSTSGQYAYLAEISHIGDVDRKYLALKELYTQVNVPIQNAWFEDFLPFGHGGPQTQYYEEKSFSYDMFSGDLTYYASAGYSISTNDGYYFKWEAHSRNPNWDFRVRWYDFKKKTWYGSDFAWGVGFKTTSSVIEIVESGNKNAAFRYTARGSFYVRAMSGAIRTVAPPSITFTNFVNPHGMRED